MKLPLHTVFDKIFSAQCACSTVASPFSSNSGCENWPRKYVAHMDAFNLFENTVVLDLCKRSFSPPQIVLMNVRLILLFPFIGSYKFRCALMISRIYSKHQWQYTCCQHCHRMTRPDNSAYADPHTYICSGSFCPSTSANIV